MHSLRGLASAQGRKSHELVGLDTTSESTPPCSPTPNLTVSPAPNLAGLAKPRHIVLAPQGSESALTPENVELFLYHIYTGGHKLMSLTVSVREVNFKRRSSNASFHTNPPKSEG